MSTLRQVRGEKSLVGRSGLTKKVTHQHFKLSKVRAATKHRFLSLKNISQYLQSFSERVNGFLKCRKF